MITVVVPTPLGATAGDRVTADAAGAGTAASSYFGSDGCAVLAVAEPGVYVLRHHLRPTPQNRHHKRAVIATVTVTAPGPVVVGGDPTGRWRRYVEIRDMTHDQRAAHEAGQ